MNKNKGIFLIFLTAVISALVVFISKYGVSVINPYIFTGLKNIIVTLFLVSWLLMMKDWQILKKLERKQWLILLVIGFIGGFLAFLLYFKGLSLTTGIQAAFIHKSMFIFIFAFAFIFLKEKISKNILIIGFSLFLINILLLKLTDFNLNWGDFLILTATLLWAIENILSKYLLKELSPRIIIWARMFFGSMFIILFLLMTGQAILITSLTLEQISWVMITSIFLLGYVFTWYTGLKYLNVSTAAVILLLAGPISFLLSQNLQVIGLFLLILSTVLFFKFYARQRKPVKI